MSEAEQATAAAQAATDAATAQAATDTTTAAQAAADTKPDVSPEIQKLIDEAATKAATEASRSANKEAEGLRKRLKASEDAEQARKDAELSDTERLQKERDTATAAATKATEDARKAVLRAEVAVLSGPNQLNIVDPDAALALLDASGIEWSDDGTPQGVKAALEALTTAKPYLVATPGTPSLDPMNQQRGKDDGVVSDRERLNKFRNPTGGKWW